MIVKTSWIFTVPPEAIWPLLCDSRMRASSSLLFKLGIPQPRACQLPSGQGGVGQPRRCISELGTIEQIILVWDAPLHLAFRMDHSDLWFRKWVTSIEDDFRLTPIDRGQTRVTRTTLITVTGPFKWPLQLGICIGLKKIHRFVFQNWQRLSMLQTQAGL